MCSITLLSVTSWSKKPILADECFAADHVPLVAVLLEDISQNFQGSTSIRGNRKRSVPLPDKLWLDKGAVLEFWHFFHSKDFPDHLHDPVLTRPDAFSYKEVVTRTLLRKWTYLILDRSTADAYLSREEDQDLVADHVFGSVFSRVAGVKHLRA